MTGDPAPPPRRKIQALLVSVNYADYLECIAPNMAHFDRWLVVTDENDTRTREVCARHGMEVHFSRRLYKDGAAFHKAAALNDGLAALDQDAWVAVMDSDILLPHDFRERLDAQTLDPAALYGLAGRRVCPKLAEFRILTAHEPWADNLIYTTFVIGYFNLFHLAQEWNRYPEDGSDDASTYDVLFSESFPAALRHYLPFVCLHAGDASQNWRGRVSDPFFENSGDLHTAAEGSTERIAAALGGPGSHAVQVGCYRGALSRTLARHFSRVSVLDHWGLHLPATAPALAVDLEILARRYAEETAGLSNLTPLEHSGETFAAIPDASLDALWLTPEPEYDFLLQFLPAWLPKLKPGGAIAGGFYSPELLPGPARIVHLLLGPPDESFPDMQWIRRLADPATLAARLFTPPPAGETGVVYVCLQEHETEALLVSLSSLRRHWSGPVCVLNAGDESGPLKIACLRLGVTFLNVPAVHSLLPDSVLRIHALDWSPYQHSLYLNNATLIHGPVDWLLAPLDQHHAVFCEGRHAAPDLSAFAWRRDSSLLDSWRSIAGAFVQLAGEKAAALALGSVMEGEDGIRLLPPGPLWSGPVRRIPPQVRILALPRLDRAGALHLHAPWVEEEQTLIRLMEQPPV